MPHKAEAKTMVSENAEFGQTVLGNLNAPVNSMVTSYFCALL
jgi:hypothetical protein